MKLTNKQQSNLEAFLNTKNLKRKFPFLHQILSEEMLEDGTTYKFDSYGFCRELSESQKLQVEKLEKEYSNYNLKVLFVLETVMVDPAGDKIEMDSYVYITDEDTEYGVEITKNGVMMPVAFIHNKSWDDKESGYILIKEIAGTMRRLG